MLQIRPPGPDEDKWPGEWQRLTEVFFPSLRQAIANKALENEAVQQALDAWQRSPVSVGEDRLPFTEAMSRMRAMLWCADYVQKTASLSDNAPPAVLTEVPPDAPPEARNRADCSLACVRIFRGEASRRRIAVPIALADEMIQLKGGIATLVFDVYSPGNGRLTLNPEESFRIVSDDDFTASLSTAWRLALEVAKNEDGRSEFPDVVWRVIKESPSMAGLDEKAFFESAGLRWKGPIAGRSASGAASRAFHHLLKGTNPDPDVFVLAQVCKNGTPTSEIQGVGGISAKVEAIADTGHSATVVVTEKDKAEASLAVSKKKANSRIHIDVNIPAVIKSLFDEGRKLAEEGRYSEAKAKYEEALKQSDVAGHALARVKAKVGIASILRLEEPDAAQPIFRECLDELRATPSERLLEEVLGKLGDLEAHAGNLLEAKALLADAQQIARRLDDRLRIAGNLQSLAWVANGGGKPDEALQHFDQAAEMFMAEYQRRDPTTEKHAMRGLGACFNNKSIVQKHKADLVGALASLEKAVDCFRRSDSQDDLTAALFLLAEAKFAEAKWQEGSKCLDESLQIALKRNDHVWVCQCMDLGGRLKFTLGDEKGALELFAKALALMRKNGKPKELLRYMGKLACVCLKRGLSNEARKLMEEERDLAEKHGLLEHAADAVLDLAQLENGPDADERKSQAVKTAIAKLESLVARTEIKGHRAFLMGRIGSLHQRLRLWEEALVWFVRAKEIFEEIGDIAGLASCYGSFAEIRHEQDKPQEELEAYRAILRLVSGKPIPRLVAGTKINMGVHLMRNGSFREAQRLFQEAAEVCRRHHLHEFDDAVEANLKRVEHWIEAYKPAAMDFPQLIRELHELVAFFPEAKDSLLRFWYYCRDAELHANCRSMLGLKFYIVEDDTQCFLELVDRLAAYSDLALQAVNTTFPGWGMDLVPYPKDRHLPERVAQTRVKRTADGQTFVSFVRGSFHSPYCVTSDEASSKTTGNSGWVIVGRARGLPPQSHELMLGLAADQIVAKRVLFFPFERRDDPLKLSNDLQLAKAQSLIPLYLGRLPESDEVESVAQVAILVPVIPTTAITT
ncbi:MAG: tetratricopeptide repeat protein, partial [Verrucomicrobia bacterium]|nr:tetratricopeptide repeat protein [Verrucomicrobiota bacterium]